uniref:Uncharacterized protein n=1 Tax=Malurus cyaneus samueli TaxID=2593467 RepID=A0A8C5TRN6_9PASS
ELKCGASQKSFFLEAFKARPSLTGLEWAAEHWHSVQSVVDRITALRLKAKSKPREGKAVVCAVLGAALASAVRERAARTHRETAVIKTLKVQVRSLQAQVAELEGQLEKSRNQNRSLIQMLQKELVREPAMPAAAGACPDDGTAGALPPAEPRKEQTGSQTRPDGAARLCPLIKTEFLYENDQDQAPVITTKEVPFTATELAKLKKDFSRHPRESETEFVWRVSLSGGDQILLSEKEAEGYWGPGVFLTTGDHRAPWSLTQRAAFWAGSLNPLERGDPLAIECTTDEIVESVQKTACIQMMCERKLTPLQESPMMLRVDADRMTPLIRGLPDSIKPIAIQLQGKIQALAPLERMAAALDGTISSPAGDGTAQGGKVWTWGEVAQELINFGRKYGPVKLVVNKAETLEVRHARSSPRLSPKISPHSNQSEQKRPLTRQGIWSQGLQKGIPKRLMDGLSTDQLEQVTCKMKPLKSLHYI